VSTGEKYVAAAYVVVLVAVLAYVAIISLKLARLEREVTELARLAEESRLELDQEPEHEEARVG
jgi:CcmD family protein